MTRPSRRLLLPAAACAALALAPTASAAPAADGAAKVSEPTVEAAVKAISSGAAERRRTRTRKPRQRGGRVRLAWPRDRREKAPESAMARWLARQVGPVRLTNDGPTARSAAAAPSAVTFIGADAPGRMQLVRSFDIPKKDDDHERLANLSWTYDNALAAMAFIDAGAKSQAEQLLDQLMALQRSDGSLDFAYDTFSGAGSAQIRSGALAWVGLAATYYRRTYGSTRYDPLIAGATKYLLRLRTPAGLVTGGPDVSWVSTQHNLLTVGLLRDLVSSLRSKPASSSLGLSIATLDAAQSTMGNAILSQLIVEQGPRAYFIEGVGDTRIPIDVQSLGAMYLKLRGDGRYAQVGNYLLTSFIAEPRVSSAVNGVLFGFRPFNASAAPNVVWSEGTIQAAVALGRIGLSTSYASYAVANLAAHTANFTKAPPAADRDATTDLSWGEYHTWPASAAASWLVMLAAGEGGQLFTR